MNESNWPLVSAIMLCYNQARFAVECLESIKAQNYPNLELIVNDDASQDDSVSVIQAWLGNSSMPHRFLRSERNCGICRSMNKALSLARGKYVSGIAADDLWLPGKLRRQVEMMERLSAKVGVVYSDALRVDESGNVLPVTFLEAFGRYSNSTTPQGNVQTALWQANFVAPMTTLVRRECYDRVGLFDESLFAEDWDMWLRISRYYDFVYSPEISAKYRVVETSASRGQLTRLVDDEHGICLKHLREGYLNGEVRLAAVIRLYNFAICSYERKTLRHKRNLLQALRYRPTPGLALRCIFALCGIGSGHFARIRRSLQGQKSGLSLPVETAADSKSFQTGEALRIRPAMSRKV